MTSERYVLIPNTFPNTCPGTIRGSIRRSIRRGIRRSVHGIVRGVVRGIIPGIIFELIFAGGCATSNGSTWEDDRAEGITTRPRLRNRPARAPDLASARNEEFENFGGESRRDQPNEANAWSSGADRTSGDETALEHMLRRFSVRFPAIAAANKGLTGRRNAGWSTPMVEAWTELLDRLLPSLTQEDAQPSLRLLLQARVYLEVELENTERAFGPAPSEIRTGVGSVFVEVSRHMRTLARSDRRRRPPRTFLGPRLEWPVAPLIVTSGFGYRRDPIRLDPALRFHSGIDIGGQRGSVVGASAPGLVIEAGWRGGHGRSVRVLHEGGFTTVYSHLGTIFVQEGDEIDTGSPIGLMGSSGRTTGPHLHFEVHKHGQAIDPMDVIGRAMLSLLLEPRASP